MGSLFSKKEIKLVVVGLDNSGNKIPHPSESNKFSGKTTIIKSLKPKKSQDDSGTTPTVGYQIE